MTDLEILQNVIETLDAISVPMNQLQQIGFPIYNANNQLKQLYLAVINAQEKREEEEVVVSEANDGNDVEDAASGDLDS